MLHSKQDTKMTVLNILGYVKYLNLLFSCSQDTNVYTLGFNVMFNNVEKTFFQTDPAAVKTCLPLSYN